MFYNCSSLSDIKSLENWNVSNGNDFSYMFIGCSFLLDIKSLKNWKYKIKVDAKFEHIIMNLEEEEEEEGEDREI